MNAALAMKLKPVRQIAFGVGLIGLIALLIGFFSDRVRFFSAYLIGFIFWFGLSLGCLAVALIHYLTGGKWGAVTRRFLEAGFMVLPVMAILFLPLLLGLKELYPWARPEAVAASDTLQQRAIYLNPLGFVARAVLFFGIWGGLVFLLRKWSRQQDATTDVSPTVRLRALSGPGIVIVPLTGTFALVDWVLSIEPRWASSIFPLIVLMGFVLLAISFVTMLCVWLRNELPLRNVVRPEHFHQLGNLLLAFVVFWTYVSFSQFLIIYSGNLPREIEWYSHRIAGGWKWLVVALALFHFFVPFFLLLFRMMKKSPARLGKIAAWIFAVHFVEVFWVIKPSFFPHGLHVHWLDVVAVLGIGGIWMTAFLWQLKRASLLPQNDPRLEFTHTQLADAK